NDVGDVETLPPVQFHLPRGDLARFVGRIVQYLDLQPVLRVVEPTDRSDEPFNDVHLIIDRQLHRQPGKSLEASGRGRRTTFEFVEQEQHEVAVQAVTTQQGQRSVVQNDPNQIVSFHKSRPTNFNVATRTRPFRGIGSCGKDDGFRGAV